MAELDLIKAETSALVGRCSSIMRISSGGRSSNSILEIKKKRRLFENVARPFVVVSVS
jgi:hypothetical protein